MKEEQIKHELFKFVDWVIDNKDPNQLMEAYDIYVIEELSHEENQ